VKEVKWQMWSEKCTVNRRRKAVSNELCSAYVYVYVIRALYLLLCICTKGTTEPTLLALISSPEHQKSPEIIKYILLSAGEDTLLNPPSQ
jgi:hypothetical protein